MTFVFLVSSERRDSAEDEVIFPSDDVSTVLSSVKKLLQYDMRRRQATAIVLMGVIGAEFQSEVEVYEKRAKGEAGGRDGNGATGSVANLSIMLLFINVCLR